MYKIFWSHIFGRRSFLMFYATFMMEIKDRRSITEFDKNLPGSTSYNARNTVAGIVVFYRYTLPKVVLYLCVQVFPQHMIPLVSQCKILVSNQLGAVVGCPLLWHVYFIITVVAKAAVY